MSDALIFIPSRGRAGAANTPLIIPPELHKETAIVCSPGEKLSYSAAYPTTVVIEAPEGTRNIGMKRQWIIHSLARRPRIIMLDDDLKLFERTTDNRLVGASPAAVLAMMRTLDRDLVHHAMAGVVNRFMGNYATRPMIARNMQKVLGVNVFTLRKRGVNITVSNLEDVQLVMGCLTRGLSNIVRHEWAVSDAGYNRAGGCSSFRTGPAVEEAARALCAQFPGYVLPAVQNIPGIGQTASVRVLAAKAYRHALAREGR